MPIPLIFLMKKNGFHFHQKRASRTTHEAFSTRNTGTFKPSGTSTSTSASAKNWTRESWSFGKISPILNQSLGGNSLPKLELTIFERGGSWFFRVTSLEIEKTVDLPVLCFLQSEFVTHVVIMMSFQSLRVQMKTRRFCQETSINSYQNTRVETPASKYVCVQIHVQICCTMYTCWSHSKSNLSQGP